MFTNPALASLIPADWKHHGFWKQDVFVAVFLHNCFNLEELAKLDLPIQEAGCFIFGGGHEIIKPGAYDELRVLLREDLADGTMQRWQTILKESERANSAALSLSQHLTSPLTAIEWKEVMQTLNRVALFWMLAGVYLNPLCDEIIEDAFNNAGLRMDSLAHFVETPDTPLGRQPAELWALKKRFVSLKCPLTEEALTSHPELAKAVEEHRQAYAWIEFHGFVGNPLSTARLLELIELAEKPLIHTKESAPQSAELRAALQLFEINSALRQASAEYFTILSFAAYPLLETFAEQETLLYRNFLNLTPQEVLAFLEGDLSNNELHSLVETRKNDHWATLTHHGEVITTSNASDLAELEKIFVPRTEEKTEEVRGQVANKGVATGKAKIILNSDDFHKMKPGDILISTMTTPAFVVLMQQAAAIVTDIGGLLCHAAIVSREINTPCVIGTKFATHIIHDGDLVEVNANTGVITVLERAMPTAI